MKFERIMNGGKVMFLECKDVVKKYMAKSAVDGVGFSIERGQIYAVLGPNGSGKTTMMKMIAGLVKPSSGTILFEDQPIGVNSKSKIAYMSTEPYFYSYMTVDDVGKYYKDFFLDFDEQRYHELLVRMDLNRKDKAKNLSSGQMAKLKIAVTLARKAELYMLDEPLNGIDVIARERIITTILESAGDEVSIMMSSHLVDELEKIIDHVLFMKDGQLIMQGDAEAIRLEHGKSILELYKEIYA